MNMLSLNLRTLPNQFTILEVLRSCCVTIVYGLGSQANCCGDICKLFQTKCMVSDCLGGCCVAITYGLDSQGNNCDAVCELVWNKIYGAGCHKKLLCTINYGSESQGNCCDALCIIFGTKLMVPEVFGVCCVCIMIRLDWKETVVAPFAYFSKPN